MDDIIQSTQQNAAEGGGESGSKELRVREGVNHSQISAQSKGRISSLAGTKA
jgi:hypothetical protein